MNCARTRRILDAWIDNELDAATRNDIGDHLASCPTCGALRAEREQLHATIQAAVPRETAPAAFVTGLRRALVHESDALNSRRRGPTWLNAIALAGASAVAGALAVFAWLHMPVLDVSIEERAVASHVAALTAGEGRPERLVQVSASDRHVVKPWFLGKIDFSPPVRDLAEDGFMLLGARLDRVGDHKAAVVVYRIRNHPIDLFVWRAANDDIAPIRFAPQRGFGVVTWSQYGLRFAAVSDVDPRDLERFARKVQSAATPPS